MAGAGFRLGLRTVFVVDLLVANGSGGNPLSRPQPPEAVAEGQSLQGIASRPNSATQSDDPLSDAEILFKGPGPPHCPRVAQVRRARSQPIQPGKNQAVDVADGHRLWRSTPQYIELMSKDEDFGLATRHATGTV